MTPADSPGRFRGSQVPAFPQMQREGRQKFQGVLRRSPARNIRERNRVLEQETHYEPRDADVNRSYCRTSLPCALAGAPGTRGWEHKHWAQPIGLQISKVIKIGRLPVKLAVQPQYMPVHPDLFGQKWNLQFAITPVIPKLVKGNLFGD